MREGIIDKIRTSVDDCVKSIVYMYQNAAGCMKIRSKTVKRKQEPWWDNQCEQIKKENIRH